MAAREMWAALHCFCGRQHRKCGSRAQEDTPSAPSLQDAPQWVTPVKTAAHTHLCVFRHAFVAFRVLSAGEIHARAQICHPVWRRNLSWPDLTTWPLPSFLQFLLLRLNGVQLLIAKGLNLTPQQQQEGTRFVLHGWLPVTGSNSTNLNRAPHWWRWITHEMR